MTRSYLKSDDYEEESSGGVMHSSAMRFLLGYILLVLIYASISALIYFIQGDSGSDSSSSTSSVEYKNALEKAKIYYYDMKMSRENTRKMLSSERGENFPDDVVDYAMRHLED